MAQGTDNQATISNIPPVYIEFIPINIPGYQQTTSHYASENERLPLTYPSPC